MEINIDDDLVYKEAKQRFQVQWLLNQMRDGESLVSMADRTKITRKTIRLILDNGISENPERQNITSGCWFCKTKENLEVHHIYGRTKDDTVHLCERCHKKFHGLNKSFSSAKAQKESSKSESQCQ